MNEPPTSGGRVQAPTGGMDRMTATIAKGDAMRLIDFFTDLYRPLRLRGRSPATNNLYGCLIRSFGRYLKREPMLSDLDELVISRFLEYRATKVRPFTVERERNGLNALAKLAFERRLLDVLPSVPQGTIPDRVPVAWSVEELRRIMAAAADPTTFYKRPGRPPLFRPAADAAKHMPSHEWRATFFTALVPTLWETAERIGALLGATIEDYQRPHMLVRAESRKGRKRDRLYLLTPETCDLIERLIGSRKSGAIFAWPLCRPYLWRNFGRVVKAAGLDGRHRVRFHQIRRSAASHYAAAGGDACAMLDHSSPQITSRWYLDPRLTDRHAKPCDVLPPIFHSQREDEGGGAAAAGAVPVRSGPATSRCQSS